MTDIVVEREWDAPLDDADMDAMIRASDECLGIHRVTWLESLLSADRRSLVCRFRGPDAESVRIALRQAGSATGRVWPGTVHMPPGRDGRPENGANVLVSRAFDQPTEFDAIQALEDAGRHCLETHRVRFVRTFFSTDRRRMICLYAAPDAESVRIAQREAGMPVDRVWAFRRFHP